jgi:hypothetical protein
MRFLFIFLVSFILQSSFFANYSLSQYAPQVGNVGSTAIHKDSSIISTFNNYYFQNGNNKLIRGWQNIADTSFGKASVGSIDSIGIPPFLLSLGDGGSATFELVFSVIDGPGPDFVVFENGFSFSKDSFFLELAFVEVSYDGKKYVRFPSFSQTDTVTQVGAFGSLKAHQIHNLAGKYTAPYGVPFDLSEIRDSLDGHSTVNFIRIVDVVGSTDPKYGSRDSRGQTINDPWPTPFPSSGFDLSGIGFVNLVLMGLESSEKLLVQTYPNPIQLNEKLTIQCQENIAKVAIIDINGIECGLNLKSYLGGRIDLDLNLPSGFYILSITGDSGKSVKQKIVIQP